ncbi:Y4yA family PLP-dependent enzyme [uncultured Aquitalea sp.]|uniref:Y4yA family PLP-dependent enzyme n=1 Tax=uncultured Aquitalea sp. TaxID=540272 RepID=UPI0025F14964|nr:Y4yA family PLP-dependent enzyme [uncultured Aquitalea sp.]
MALPLPLRPLAGRAHSLPPLLDPVIAKFLHVKQHLLQVLTMEYGSPLNLVWPHCLAQNVKAMRAVLDRHEVRYEIFYGAKVNKSQALVRAAVEAGIGVDVSSIYEMNDALRAGLNRVRLCATGPAKTRAFHEELIARGALISVDSVEELADLAEYMHSATTGCAARVLLRYRPTGAPTSRFGMGGDELLQCLQRLAEPSSRFAFEGFHFHLGGYDVESRVQALRELTRFVEIARELGLAPRMLDIGGGFPIRYADAGGYAAFLHGQRAGDYRTGKVPASFYPYGSSMGACEWLDSFLLAQCKEGVSVARYLDDERLTLGLEPGRSLADQAAISVFRITRVKRLAMGDLVILVEGSSFSACETWFASEFLVDPILVSGRNDNATLSTDLPPTSLRAYIAGHSCLDDDVITNRWLSFDTPPQAGDLLVYANTAGYQMDLLENEFHRHPMPRRVAVTYDAAGMLAVTPDDLME